MKLTVLDMTIFGFYFALLAVIGWWASRRAAGGWKGFMATSGNWHMIPPATDPDFPWTIRSCTSISATGELGGNYATILCLQPRNDGRVDNHGRD